MDLKSRLLRFIDTMGLTKAEFERQAGLSNGYIKNFKGELGVGKLENILSAYPQLSYAWLVRGEEPMLVDPQTNVTFSGAVAPIILEDLTPVRFFEVTPTATFQEFCSGASEFPSTVNIVPPRGVVIDDSYCVFEIHGDSMAPQIQNRARVLCSEVPPSRWHQLPPCVIVIAYADRFVIKRIIDNRLSDMQYISLASDNPDYPATDRAQLADIRCIFRAIHVDQAIS